MKTLVRILFTLNAAVFGFNIVCFGFFGAPLCGVAAVVSAAAAIDFLMAERAEEVGGAA